MTRTEKTILLTTPPIAGLLVALSWLVIDRMLFPLGRKPSP